MKNWLREYGYAIYLGFALTTFAGLDLGNWQWWAIAAPTFVLVVLRR